MDRKMGKLGFGMTVIALVVCLVIVTGSTFSLFTTKDKDDISITAANVELIAKIDEASLALYSKGVAQTGKFENGGTATFTNKNHTLTFENIAPGDKATFNIVVTNESTIDIQYRIKWTYEGELGEALVATVNGNTLTSGDYSEWAKWTTNEANTLTRELAFELPITAGDQWQNKSASITFYIEAIQANAIQDSDIVTTADQLYVALEMNGFAVLGADIQLANTLTINKDATIYLAGYTLTNANGDTIVNNADLTIYEGSPIQRYSVRRNASSEAEESIGAIVSGNGSAIVNNGTLNINGGSYKGTEAAAAVNNGTLVINDGNFEATEAAAVVNTAEAVELLIENGSFTSNTEEFAIEYTEPDKVTVNGGTFTGEVPEDNLVDDGLTLEKSEDGTISIVTVNVVIGEAGYSTIQKAVDAAEDGDVIKVLVDLTYDDVIVIPADKNITLDLNGKTITATDKNVVRNDGAVVVVNNGTIKRLGDVAGYAFNNASGALTINNVTIDGGLYTSGSALTVNDSNVQQHHASRHAIYSYNCETVINNSTIHNDNAGNSAVMAAGTSVVTINGGTFSIADGRPTFGWTSCLLDAQNTASIVINDGTFNGGFRVQADASMTINNGSFNDVYGSNYNIYGSATVKGGVYTDANAVAFAKKYAAEGYKYEESVTTGNLIFGLPCAKVGSTEYICIDNAIANWTNNTTLTLLADVTLLDTVVIKSTEHHILYLGTYTMTAAEGKNAFEILACGTGASERTAITIQADETNPGGINAGNKCIIFYQFSNGGVSGDDRPIIKIEGGVFTGATSSFGTNAGIYFKGGSAARQAATLNISGGTFNCSINGQSKSKLLISGGTFNYSVGSQGDSTALRLISGGKFKTIGFMTADSNNTKFWIGTSMANSNVGVYVDDAGYIVIGGAVITEAGDRFVAYSTNYSGASSYLQYSSAKNNGLYYTSVYEALADNNKTTGVVTVYADEIDLTGNTYKGTINIVDTLVVTFAEGATPTWKVATALDGMSVEYTDSVVDGVVTRTYTLQ